MTSREAALGWVVVAGELRRASEFAELTPSRRPLALCPLCERPTTLKLGKLRAHHAAHRPSDICVATAPETALHLNAKFHLATQLRTVATINLRTKCATRWCEQVGHRGWAVTWDSVEVERPVGSRRPDLTLGRGGVPVAAIEVFATHAVDDEKAQVLAALQIPWVEVRAAEVLGETSWAPTSPLPVAKEGPHSQWFCDSCTERKENGEFSICARLVDCYFRSGKRWRDVYEIAEEREKGTVVAVILRAWKDEREIRFEGGRSENKAKVQREFAAWMNEFQRRGAIVDMTTEWMPDGVDWLSSDLIAFSDLHYPRRYKWNETARCWQRRPSEDQ